MMDELRRYVENRIGFSVADDFYFHCINQLSSEMVRFQVSKELKEYFENHNNKLLSDETIEYVKKRIKLFKDMIKIEHFPNVQDINYQTVKEISIISKHDNYDDLLRMSANWISYKKQIGNKEESWSYKTISDEYFNNYEMMIETFNHLQHCPPEFEYNDNDCKLSIRVTFNDDTYFTFYRSSSFGSNSMYQQAISIIRLIPNNEIIPKYLQPFKKVILTKDNIDELKDRTIIGIFYGGDMGRIGALDIITSRFELISSDNKKGYFNVYDFASNFNSYKELLGVDFIYKSIIKFEGDCWYPLYLGAGNRVFLNDRLHKDLIEYLFSSNHGISYKKWNRLVLNED